MAKRGNNVTEKIIYSIHDFANGIKVATKQEDGRWAIYVGNRSGDLRHYKTIAAMDKEMTKRGYEKLS